MIDTEDRGSGKGWVAAVAVGAIAVALIYGVAPRVNHKVRGEIDAERITLRDRYGNVRLLAEVGKDNTVRLILADGAGVHRAVFKVTAGGRVETKVDRGDVD